MPSLVKYEEEYSSELSRTTSPTLRAQKCESTFLKGPGSPDRWISAMLEGSVAYIGDEVGISCVGCCWGEAKARKLGVTQLKSPMSTRSNFSYLGLSVLVNGRDSVNILLEAEVLETAEALFLGLPYTVDDVLDVQNIVGLAVASVAEGHARRVHLGNGRQSKVRWP